jgi:hypothetical protein
MDHLILYMLADKSQRRFGFTNRHHLHDKVLEMSGADEGEVDAAVYAYCTDTNVEQP